MASNIQLDDVFYYENLKKYVNTFKVNGNKIDTFLVINNQVYASYKYCLNLYS